MATTAPARPGAGRPTRAEAQRRHAELLDAALDMFMERGFELTTIEAICGQVGMTKRTVYARYDDKAALFRAAVQRAVEQWNEPLDQLDLDESDLEGSLVAIAKLRARGALTPGGLKLQRLLNAEAWRFPDIFELGYRQGTQPAIRYIADFFARHAATGTIIDEPPETLASSFLALAVGGLTRRAVLGRDIDETMIDAHIRFSTRIFLNGVRPR